MKMDALTYGMMEEQKFESMAEEIGYERKTTFFSDLSIAEFYDIDSVKDTYNRAFAEWKNDMVYFTEFVMSLNWKCWEWAKANPELSDVYIELYEKARDYVLDNWKGEKLSYYLKTTD